MVRFSLVSLFSILALVLAFEVYLRYAGFLEAQPANYPCVAGDPILNHVFHRNCEGVATATALKTAKDVTYKTNSFGYRGPEHMPGKKTMVVLGDSYTEGFGLDEGETFPAQLGRALQQKGAADWQVLNGGTLGYTPALYVKYFDRYFLELRPDFVLLNLDFTDFNDDPYYLQIAEYDAFGNPAAFPGRDVFPAWSMSYVYSNSSAFLRFLHQEINQWSGLKQRERAQPLMDQFIQNGGIKRVPDVDLKAAGMEGCTKTVEALARNILDLNSRVKAVGGRLAVHMYPPGYLVKNYPAQPQNISFVRAWDQKNRKDFTWACANNPKAVDIFKSFSQKHGLLFFDSFPRIINHPGKGSLYFERDAHWNESGVRFVTGELAAELLPTLGQKKKLPAK